jgi:hypothetical protein
MNSSSHRRASRDGTEPTVQLTLGSPPAEQPQAGLGMIMLRRGHGAAASTTQTGPRANVIGWPDAAVNVVPPSASGRDQRTA